MQIEQSLINLCRKQNRKAQQQVYEFYYEDAFRIALRYTKNDEDAKDILNQTFFTVFTKIDQFNGDGNNFYGWVKKILVNRAIDHLRSSALRHTFLPIEEAENTLSSDQSQYLDESNVLKLIQMLPFTTSSVFNLFVMEGYNHKEISEKLGITENNSKYHLHAARQKLKSWIFKSELI